MQLLQDISAVATAIGVFVAAWQLRQAKTDARSSFEDSLNSQYREVIRDLPLTALLGRPLSDADLASALPTFYRYFDLSNEQAFLHQRGRVRPGTWSNWLEGIQQNMARPAFRQAWLAMLPDLDGSFDQLKMIIAQLPSAPSPRPLAS